VLGDPSCDPGAEVFLAQRGRLAGEPFEHFGSSVETTAGCIQVRPWRSTNIEERRKDEQFKERLRQRHEAERALYERLAR
jgi:hypothetical protein